ncbi:hypothetical protein BX616_004647, partial [Lobosporangium transversale]
MSSAKVETTTGVAASTTETVKPIDNINHNFASNMARQQQQQQTNNSIKPVYNQCKKNGSLTIVIKLGTSSICDEVTHFPLLSTLSMIVETILKLKSLGHRVILVTSGAIGVGLRRLNLPSKPKDLAQVQVMDGEVCANE